jgi:site-specific DNA recombinase
LLDARILGPRREVTEADDKLKRLYRLIEAGVTDLDDVLWWRREGVVP